MVLDRIIVKQEKIRFIFLIYLLMEWSDLNLEIHN